MTSLPILLVAVVAILSWFAFRAEFRRSRFVPCTAERALRSLRDRLSSGELTPDEYRQLLTLMS